MHICMHGWVIYWISHSICIKRQWKQASGRTRPEASQLVVDCSIRVMNAILEYFDHLLTVLTYHNSCCLCSSEAGN